MVLTRDSWILHHVEELTIDDESSRLHPGHTPQRLTCCARLTAIDNVQQQTPLEQVGLECGQFANRCFALEREPPALATNCLRSCTS